MDLKHWNEGESERAAHLEQMGVYWFHDGNPKRPYVRLRSGLISNGYFNGAVLCEEPNTLSDYVEELVEAATVIAGNWTPKVTRVVGPAMGAITFAHEVARELYDSYENTSVRMAFAEKDGDGFVFKRSKPLPGEYVLLVEDTVTTGGSVLKMRDAVRNVVPDAIVVPVLLALCNRSGSPILDDMGIISLVSGDFKTWKEGENPFTGGAEFVPVVENAKNNWNLLTQDYL